MTQDLGDVEVPGTPANSLFKVRRKLFGKLTLLLPSLQAHANFQRFEPNLGGKFPTEQYQDIIRRSVRYVSSRLRLPLWCSGLLWLLFPLFTLATERKC